MALRKHQHEEGLMPRKKKEEVMDEVERVPMIEPEDFEDNEDFEVEDEVVAGTYNWSPPIRDLMRNVPDLLTTAEAAEVVQVHAGTLSQWRRKGYGPPFVRYTPRTCFYPKDKLVDWINSRLVSFDL